MIIISRKGRWDGHQILSRCLWFHRNQCMSHTHYVLGSLHYSLVLIPITCCAPAIQTLLSTFLTLLHLILIRFCWVGIFTPNVQSRKRGLRQAAWWAHLVISRAAADWGEGLFLLARAQLPTQSLSLGPCSGNYICFLIFLLFSICATLLSAYK